jgi:GNAT superfamily N-acetyltransferase
VTAAAGPSDAEVEIRTFVPSMADDLGKLFASDPSASGCWCMWFITSVKEYHSAGAAGNRQKFEALALESKEPLGLVAYLEGQPIAWCAVGPKERFARAVRTPTLKVASAGPAEIAWFVPCFFVRSDQRRTGVTGALLRCAVDLAIERGAELIEGFPFSGHRPNAGGDRQVGTEEVFASAGFAPVRRPSKCRVIMQCRARKK